MNLGTYQINLHHLKFNLQWHPIVGPILFYMDGLKVSNNKTEK